MADIGVVYLCRFAEGDAPVRKFLASYRKHPAGVAHDLHIILKGFPNRDALDAVRVMLDPLLINTVEVDDTGYDIGSYFAVAAAVANPQLLFLNTFSEILADNWLACFANALALPGVGLVGATGSWQSIRSGYEAALLRILREPRYYINRYFGGTVSTSGKNIGLVDNDGPVDISRLVRRMGRISLYPLRVYQFDRYPNPHIRTNAFMIRKDDFLSLRGATFKKKMDAYRFESGRQSMTKQIMAAGLRPVVVDRSGEVYEIPRWKSSSTFWIDAQGNLLIADNQTNSYALGNPQRRSILRNYAWDSPRSWDL